MSSIKKSLVIIVGILVALAVIFGLLFWYTNPNRVVSGFITAVEAGEGTIATETEAATGAYTFIGPEVKQGKMENIEFFLEDWLGAETIETVVGEHVAWRSKTRLDENGNPVLNESGYEEKTTTPTPQWWAHHYEVYVDVNFSDTANLEDGFEDPVIIKLKRQTDNTNNIFAQLFRPWKVTQIRYQPFDDEDYEEIELDTEDLEGFEGEEGDVSFEINDDGELVIVDDSEEESEEEDETVEGEGETGDEEVVEETSDETVTE